MVFGFQRRDEPFPPAAPCCIHLQESAANPCRLRIFANRCQTTSHVLILVLSRECQTTRHLKCLCSCDWEQNRATSSGPIRECVKQIARKLPRRLISDQAG